MDVADQIEKLKAGDKIRVNGKFKVTVISNGGRAGILVKEPGGVMCAIRYTGATDKWWYGLSGHEDLLVTSVGK